MKKVLFSILAVLSGTLSFSQSINYHEVISMGTSASITNDIAFYNDKIFMVGSYQGWSGYALFNSTTTPDTLHGSGSFLAKYNLDGSLAWAKNIGDYTWLYSLDIDAAGYLYVTFYFSSDITFDSTLYPNMDSYGADILLAKYDQNGNEIWIRHIGGGDDDRVYDVAVDNTGNIYITGSYASNIDFDTTSTIGLTATPGNLDAFIAKFDSSGQALWANSIGGSDPDRGYGISTDANNNVLITGNYTGTMSTSVGTFTSLGETDIFLAKYDSNGNLLWVSSGGGTQGDSGIEAAFDSQGNCIVSGYYDCCATFDSIQINGVYNWDIFVAKYDPDGNVLWVRYGGGDAFFVEEPSDIAIDSNDDIFVSGIYGGDGYFGSLNMSAGGPGTRMFLVKYSSDGAEQWLDDGLSVYDNINGIVLDGNNGVYVTGRKSVITSSYDYFLLKYTDNPSTTSIFGNDITDNAGKIYPNPFSEYTTVSVENSQVIVNLKIFNVAGRLVKEVNAASESSLTIPRDNLPSGIYFLEINGYEGVLGREKIIIE